VRSDSDLGKASDGRDLLEMAAKEAADDYRQFLKESD
jgi:hypothetical protein